MFLRYEATESILLLSPAWDASLIPGSPHRYVAGTHLYNWETEKRCEVMFVI